jgi:hypothetical protein
VERQLCQIVARESISREPVGLRRLFVKLGSRRLDNHREGVGEGDRGVREPCIHRNMRSHRTQSLGSVARRHCCQAAHLLAFDWPIAVSPQIGSFFDQVVPPPDTTGDEEAVVEPVSAPSQPAQLLQIKLDKAAQEGVLFYSLAQRV